jgi:hypothetical protein
MHAHVYARYVSELCDARGVVQRKIVAHVAR